MSQRNSTRLAWSLWTLTMAVTATFLVLIYLNGSGATGWLVVASLAMSAIGYPSVGLLIVQRRPENWIGWLFCLTGLGLALQGSTAEYAIYGAVTRPGSLPAVPVMAELQGLIPQLVFPCSFSLLLLLFPTGRPPTRRWWPVAWLIVLSGMLGTIEMAVRPGELIATDRGGGQPVHLQLSNPTAVNGIAPVIGLLHQAGFWGVALSMLLASVALVSRLPRARGDERQQIKWFAYVAGLLGLTIAAVAFALLVPPIHWLGGWISLAFVLEVAVGIPLAAGIAILRYRLYDIDAVINKSLVFGALVVFITGVYVAVVVGLGALIGTRGQPLALSILATAVVAVAFQPVRERVQRFANRLVYGKRATPYEVLAQFSDRVAGAYSGDEILPRLARVLAEGTGAARADVWMRIGPEIVPAASWPDGGAQRPESVRLTGQLLPPVPGVNGAVAIRHQGELLGALSINKSPGEPLVPVEEKLLSDLAAQAGLVLRNVRLTAELQARLAEISEQAAQLRASRQRIVAAQDAERRRLERNIHDGAQQNLVALTVKLRLASTFARRNPDRASELVRELEAESAQALETLRDLARGIYPPLLRDEGLAAALRAQAARMEIPVELDTDHVDRYTPETEAAVYFCCLEALQNVAKHARASRVRINLRESNGELAFSVSDDGVGFDPRESQGSGLQNMADRLAALGGTLDISPTPGGTTVSGRVVAIAMEPIS